MGYKKEELERFCTYFEVPKQFITYVERFFSEEEIDFGLKQGTEEFTEKDCGKDFVCQEYRKGFISKVDETSGKYKLNNFYGMLDVFAVSRKEEFDTKFSKEERVLMDEWYFNEYYKWLKSVGSEEPTEDKVLPLEEMLEFIDAQKDRPVYLNNCDCKSLTGDCGLPVRTCITYKNGINTFVDRGLSEQIDAERAKEIIRETDKAGLMHTCNPNGICNCCDDCCYLFRGQKLLDSYAVWPITDYIVSFDESKCIGCGLCVKRCRMKVFDKDGRKITADTAHCAGCGLCVNTCPKKALTLVLRNGK